MRWSLRADDERRDVAAAEVHPSIQVCSRTCRGQRVLLEDMLELRVQPGGKTCADAGGLRAAIFYTQIHDRLLRPLIAADVPPAPAALRRALATIDRHVNTHADQARIEKAA